MAPAAPARLPQSVDPAPEAGVPDAVVEDGGAIGTHGDDPMDDADVPDAAMAVEVEESWEDIQEELGCLPSSLEGAEREAAADLARVLLSMGASSTEAKAVLVEVYSPPRVTAHATRYPCYGVLPGGAFDLRPGPDGRSWDFERFDDRAE